MTRTRRLIRAALVTAPVALSVASAAWAGPRGGSPHFGLHSPSPRPASVPRPATLGPRPMPLPRIPAPRPVVPHSPVPRPIPLPQTPVRPTPAPRPTPHVPVKPAPDRPRIPAPFPITPTRPATPKPIIIHTAPNIPPGGAERRGLSLPVPAGPSMRDLSAVKMTPHGVPIPSNTPPALAAPRPGGASEGVNTLTPHLVPNAQGGDVGATFTHKSGSPTIQVNDSIAGDTHFPSVNVRAGWEPHPDARPNPSAPGGLGSHNGEPGTIGNPR